MSTYVIVVLYSTGGIHIDKVYTCKFSDVLTVQRHREFLKRERVTEQDYVDVLEHEDYKDFLWKLSENASVLVSPIQQEMEAS